MIDAQIESLVGKTMAAIAIADDKETVDITLTNGDIYRMYHSQDCCESVQVEEVVGDLADLIGCPIVQAEEVTSSDETPPEVTNIPEYGFDESFTWTFYNLATNKGGVTIRWLGSSNGYYSESVDFVKIKEGIKDTP